MVEYEKICKLFFGGFVEDIIQNFTETINLNIAAAVRERHGPRVDVAERLEEDRLPLHHGDRRGGAKVAQAEDRRAVRDDRHEIGLRRALEHGRRVRGDLLHRERHAGRVGEAEVLLRLEGLGKMDGNLAALVELQYFFT